MIFDELTGYLAAACIGGVCIGVVFGRWLWFTVPCRFCKSEHEKLMHDDLLERYPEDAT